jgi:hypothetical protein
MMKVSTSKLKLGWIVAITIASLGCKMRGKNSDLQSTRKDSAGYSGKTDGFLFFNNPCDAVWYRGSRTTSVQCKINRPEFFIECIFSIPGIIGEPAYTQPTEKSEVKSPGLSLSTSTGKTTSRSVEDQKPIAQSTDMTFHVNCTKILRETSGEPAQLKFETEYQAAKNVQIKWDNKSPRLNLDRVNSELKQFLDKKLYSFVSYRYMKPKINEKIHGECTIENDSGENLDWPKEVNVYCSVPDKEKCRVTFSILEANRSGKYSLFGDLQKTRNLSSDWKPVSFGNFLTDATVINHLKSECKGLIDE